MATIELVQRKIDSKFKTLKLLEKNTPRVFERNKESELIKNNSYTRNVSQNQRFKGGNFRGDDRKRKYRGRN